MRPFAIVLLLCPLHVAPLTGQNDAPPRGDSGFSAFLGGGWTDLSGGRGEGGTLRPGPFGVAFEWGIGSRLSWRGELLGRIAGAKVTEVEILTREGTISRGEVGIAGQVRLYPRGEGPGLFTGLGGSVTAQTYCDVDLIGGGGFLGGETIACDEWDPVLEVSTSSASATISAGLVHGRLEAELRYDHGLRSVIATRDGNMRPRGLAIVGHYRFGRRQS